MDTSKLILAVEAANEGSEYLDYSIQRLFGLKKPVPAYTQSMDAAMQLIPESWSIHRLTRRNDCRGSFTGWMVELYRAADVVIDLPTQSIAATAPLAICASALRVLEAQRSVGATPISYSTAKRA
jgi:hypothetical protein